MSSSSQSHGSFAYHAQAIGFAASMHKPCCEIIPGQAATSLSQTGGESYATVRNFDWKGIFRFDEASSYCTGSTDHGAHNTLATVTVRGLNIANMVTADRITARVSSRHQADEKRVVGEGEITLIGSSFENLRIAGHRVTVSTDRGLFSGPCMSYEQSKENVAQMGMPHFVHSSLQVMSCRPTVEMEGLPKIPPDDRENRDAPITLCSDGGIHVREFGIIYLATVIIKPSYRRISMLRVELGCPLGGTLEAGGTEGNGTPIWQ